MAQKKRIEEQQQPEFAIARLIHYFQSSCQGGKPGMGIKPIKEFLSLIGGMSFPSKTSGLPVSLAACCRDFLESKFESIRRPKQVVHTPAPQHKGGYGKGGWNGNNGGYYRNWNNNQGNNNPQVEEPEVHTEGFDAAQE